MKFLLSTDSYHYAPTANGICVEQIANELARRGHEVHICCFRHIGDTKCETIGDITIHRINMNPINTLRYLEERKYTGLKKIIARRLMLFFNRIQAVLFLHWYPMRTPLFCYAYKRYLEQLQNQYKFDVILASYAPFEAVYALTYMNARGSFKRCLYALDSFSNFKNKRFFLSPVTQEKKGWRWEKKIYNKMDLVLNLKCHEQYHQKSRYDAFRNKMRFVDIPHMIKQDDSKTESMESGKTYNNLLYAGLIREEIFPHVINLFYEELRTGEIVFDVYTRTNVEAFYMHIPKEIQGNIKNHGFVDRSIVLREEKNASVLLSMGNPDSDFIPSKIFELIATGNKIVHIYSYDKDSALPYYAKYPNSCCINIKESLEENRAKLRNFLTQPKQELSFDELRSTYYENTPEYTADILCQLGGVQ